MPGHMCMQRTEASPYHQVMTHHDKKNWPYALAQLPSCETKNPVSQLRLLYVPASWGPPWPLQAAAQASSAHRWHMCHLYSMLWLLAPAAAGHQQTTHHSGWPAASAARLRSASMYLQQQGNIHRSAHGSPAGSCHPRKPCMAEYAHSTAFCTRTPASLVVALVLADARETPAPIALPLRNTAQCGCENIVLLYVSAHMGLACAPYLSAPVGLAPSHLTSGYAG
jgi:hypothetical protein